MMLKATALLFMLSSIFCTVQGQNLIRNGSFESFNTCPDFLDQLERANFWTNPSEGTPDFFHRCAGSGPCIACVPNYYNSNFQEPQTGDGFAGLQISEGGSQYREYIRSELTEPLDVGQEYRFTMYVNLADHCQVTTVSPQIDFSTDNYSSTSSDGFFSRSPDIDFDTIIHDKDNWVQLTSCFIAESADRYITIGNFKTDQDIPLIVLDSSGSILLTTYYIIDDISLERVFPVGSDILPDSIMLCEGDTLDLLLPSGHHYIWSDGVNQNPRKFFQSGEYSVMTSDDCGPSTFDTIFMAFRGDIDLGLPDSVFICENGSVLLKPSGDVDAWLWSDGSTADTFLITQPGIVWVEAMNACDTIRDSIHVTRVLDPFSTLPTDTVLCEGDTLWLFADPRFNPVWEGRIRSDSFMITSSGSYILELMNHCAIVVDFIRVDFQPRPEVNFGIIDPLCNGDSILIIPQVQAENWKWFDQTMVDSLWIKQGGFVGIEAQSACGVIRDSIFIPMLDVPQAGFPKDTILCEGEQLEISFPSDYNVLWNDGTSTLTKVISSEGLYWVELSNICGQNRDSIQVQFIDPPDAQLGPDTAACTGDTIILTYSGPDDWIWSTGDVTNEIKVTTPGVYYIEVSNDCGLRRDSISVDFQVIPTLELPDSLRLCEDEEIILTPISNQTQWIWSDGSRASDFVVNRSSKIWATTENLCGLASDTTEVVVSPLPQFDFISNDQSICLGDSLLIEARSSNATIEWLLNSQSSSTLLIDRPGTYTVIASNNCGTIEVDINISGEDCGCDVFVPNTFTPNGDNVNDVLEVFAACNLEKVQFQIYSRWGELVFQSTEERPLWDGNYNEQVVTPDVFVYFLSYEIGGQPFNKGGSVTVLR